jgi:antitoxin (DNA-binding transcriptional repressor) of toxin-antitoxin stability system
MKTITIRQLHERTGHWVRQAERHGEILVTDSGDLVAKIVPEPKPRKVPFFAHRPMSREFKKLSESGKLGVGAIDVTEMISEDREDRYT